MIHLDTHVVVWLHAGERERLSPLACALIERDELVISPMVELELAFLHEIKRIRFAPDAILGALHAEFGLALAQDPWSAVAHRAIDLTWTRDPFDRLIAANAVVAGVRLLSRDENLQLNLPSTVCW